MDLSRFNDPMTEKVEWTPMKSGGANFKTNILKQKSRANMHSNFPKENYIYRIVWRYRDRSFGGGLIALLSGEIVALFFLLSV